MDDTWEAERNAIWQIQGPTIAVTLWDVSCTYMSILSLKVNLQKTSFLTINLLQIRNKRQIVTSKKTLWLPANIAQFTFIKATILSKVHNSHVHDLALYLRWILLSSSFIFFFIKIILKTGWTIVIIIKRIEESEKFKFNSIKWLGIWENNRQMHLLWI